MLVTFVSQCEKKALKRTRRILDAFANRIGDNVWQTAITEEGLVTVKKLLRQSATRSTAVSCHRVRTRQRTELVWIVGNRRKFNAVGIVPVNWTEDDVSIYQDSHEWKSLPLIQHASAIAGLFHDFGKANKLFQDKINPNLKTETFEPYRHEWVSLRLFEAFVKTAGKTDEDWINKLANADFENITPCQKDGIDIIDNKNPLNDLPEFAKLVGWLILSHHKLPLFPHWDDSITANKPLLSDVDKWFDDKLSALWNSPKCTNPEEKERIKDNWLLEPLPYQSIKWTSYVCTKLSESKNSLLALLHGQTDFLHEQLFTSHLARLALILADHHVSSYSLEQTQKKLSSWGDVKYSVYANTDWNDNDERVYKQQLDQHLIAVAQEAEKICKQLPRFKKEMPSLPFNKLLEESKTKNDNFKWQDDSIKTAEALADNTLTHGFFGINMASTGKGKTRANAKIMYALGKETGKIRFNVAIGLRTLTLQTGKEFQKDLGISKNDISIAVGGIAVKELFENTEKKSVETSDTGSESAYDFLNSDFKTSFDGTIEDHPLYQWTTKRNSKEPHRTNKLLQPPVLVCTIDHLIPATEGTKGGQQIAPMLRLLTSDLVLDEPDDFGLSDLPALCRLVHWTGMLGRRVILSTATMPPALVYACYKSYEAGWAEYAKVNLSDWDGSIQCAWFDEFYEHKKNNPSHQPILGLAEFKKQHNKFVNYRINKLEQLPAKRIGKVVNIIEDTSSNLYQNTANTIFNSIKELHSHHHVTNNENSKKVSIGLVRMANIDPMVKVAKALLALNAPDNTTIYYCVYHSRYPLAIRSHIEGKLDTILKRKDSEQLWSNEKGIGGIVNHSETVNHIFVVLASPVAEVGRDHDYDWAIVEPSSMRSIIQIAGRVLRHRDIYPKVANIHLLNKNIKVLKGKSICFEKPGFESKEVLKVVLNKKSDMDLKDWLTANEISSINANPKIKLPKEIKPKNSSNYQIFDYLSEMEHQALINQLFGNYKKEQDKDTKIFITSAKPWWCEHVHWSGEIQYKQKFRKSDKDLNLVLYIESELHHLQWKEKNNEIKSAELEPLKSISINRPAMLDYGFNSQFWFNINEEDIYLRLLEDLKKYSSLAQISERFGVINVPLYQKLDGSVEFEYHSQLGLYRNEENK